MRLVVKGFMQKYGEQYRNTFAPCVQSTSVRLLCAIAVKYNMKVAIADADQAYTQAEQKKFLSDTWVRLPREQWPPS